MGLFTLIEDRPTPKQVYNWRIYLCAVIACFAACGIGYDSSFIGTSLALPSFKSEFNFASYGKEGLAKLQADIVSVYQAGAFFGSLSAYVSGYYLGRRLSLFVFVVFFLVGAAMNCGATGDKGLGLIIGGRVLTGWAVGGCSSLVPIYISEISPPAIRGRLGGIWEIAWQVGGMVGFWINYGVNRTMAPTHTQWLIPFAIQLVPVGMLFFGLLYIPESPRWLFTKGRRNQAIKTLCWLRQLEQSDLYIVEEIGSIDSEIERFRHEVGTGFWKPFAALKKRSVQWRFILGGLLFMWQNGSGINAINYYSPTVFASIGVTGTSTSFLATGIFGLVKSVECFIWAWFFIDRFGRRTLLIWGSLGGSVCMWFLGAYIKVANQDPNATDTKMTPGGIAAIFFFFLWTVPYQLSWSGTPWVINSEIFDLNTRSLGQASAAANNWFWNFIISRFTPTMFLTMKYGVYFFFASMMILSSIFVFFVLPETSNIPLESMDRLFAVKPVSKANKTIMEQLRAEEEEFRHNVAGADLKGNRVETQAVENV